MVPLLIAVTEDLGRFAFEAFRGFFMPKKKETEATQAMLPAPEPLLALPVAEELPVPDASFDSVPDIALVKNTVMYTASYAAPLKNAPSHKEDATITVLPYGSMVMIIKVEGVWAYVISGTHAGWVYAADLEDRAAHVYPSFDIGEENRDDDPSTIRLRALIQDEFGAGELGLPLQAEEYALYRLYRRNVRPVWPQIRPRSPGSWSRILEGQEGVRIDSRPKGGAVMEFTLAAHEGSDPIGHLAYIEAVFPDDSLQVTEANWPDQGIYNERVLVKEEWEALKPSFLHFS
jgi:hypothetical protein